MRISRVRMLRLLSRSDVLVVLTVLLLFGTAVVVYTHGGTTTVWPHMFYLPVVGAAGTWGMRAGLITAVSAGLLCGPVMPLDVADGVPQTTGGWVLRTVFFCLVVIAAAAARRRMIHLDDARQALLASVSHEARTPLTAVLGFSELLLERYDELTDSECREFAALIRQEAGELSNVIDHYMVDGRIQHNMTVDSVEVDLRRVVDIVLMGIPGEIRRSRIDTNGEEVRVYADPLRVRQIVRSLINNALAYGGDRVFILVREESGNGIITVTGIRQDLAAAKEKGPHPSAAPLGVGLAVARRLTELMGGRLIYKLNGDGAFELQLPGAPTHRRSRPHDVGLGSGRQGR